MKTGARFIIIEVVSVCLAIAVFLALCLKREVDTPFISKPRAVTIGETLNCEPYALAALTVKEISDGGDCLVEVRPIANVEWQRKEGWVKTGESIAFAQDLFGKTNIYIEHIEGKKIFVVFQSGSGGYKYRLRLPWDY
jgi:hypothetical protein